MSPQPGLEAASHRRRWTGCTPHRQGCAARQLFTLLRIGHASREFTSIRDWVEKKVRRHLERAGTRPGFGWKRWSRQWLYQELGLYEDYSLRHLGVGPKAPPSTIRHINLGVK